MHDKPVLFQIFRVQQLAFFHLLHRYKVIFRGRWNGLQACSASLYLRLRMRNTSSGRVLCKAHVHVRQDACHSGDWICWLSRSCRWTKCLCLQISAPTVYIQQVCNVIQSVHPFLHNSSLYNSSLVSSILVIVIYNYLHRRLQSQRRGQIVRTEIHTRMLKARSSLIIDISRSHYPPPY